MAVTRYNSSLHGKVVAGKMKKSPYIVGYFETDAEALAWNSDIQEIQANGCKLGLSKVIREFDNPELSDPHTETDTYDGIVEAWYSVPGSSKRQGYKKVVLPNLVPGVTDQQMRDIVLQMYTELNDGSFEKFNQCGDVLKRPANVVTGGITSERMPSP